MPELSGHLSLQAALREHGRTVLAAQSFRAPFHVSKPYWDADTRTLLVQVVNPTAGILAGDRLQSTITVDRGAALLVTTPSASRIFHMQDGAAECHQRFTVAAGGWLEVMPEPLVPHRGCRYHQRTSIEVDCEGALFFVDQLLPGRLAHGEAWAWDRLILELTVRVAGELVLRERLDQRGEELCSLAQLAASGPNACFAHAIAIGVGGTAPWHAELDTLHRDGLWLGTSAIRFGGWSIKLVACDALRLRDGLREVRRVLSRYFPRLGCDPRKL
jgi:urease accessory protein